MGVAKGLFTNYRYITLKIMTTTVANNIVSSLSEEESFRTYNKTHMWCIWPTSVLNVVCMWPLDYWEWRPEANSDPAGFERTIQRSEWTRNGYEAFTLPLVNDFTCLFPCGDIIIWHPMQGWHLTSLWNTVRCSVVFSGLVCAASMSAMERTELKMAVIAEQLGLSWAGKWTQIHRICFYLL